VLYLLHLSYYRYIRRFLVDDIRVHLQMTHLPRRGYFKFSNTCITLFEMAKVSP